jgi:hypothetical protein
MAAMFRASCRPSRVPREAASRTLASCFIASPRIVPRVSGLPVSGTSIFASRIVPGAVMMTAVKMCLGSTPNEK